MDSLLDDETKIVNQYLSLVRYNNPVLIAKHVEKKKISIEKQKQRSQVVTDPLALDETRETEEILNAILPPRFWQEDANLWQQTVSTTPATRQDVINLQELLDTRLKQTGARETAICPIRREIYSQCFDEIIRQVTINCSERGLLLLQVRDEIANTMSAYETLYCSAVAYGLRKALQSHEKKELLRERIKTLESNKQTLEELINEMKTKIEQTQRRDAEFSASEQKKHAEEIILMKKGNSQLKTQLEGITATKNN